MSTSKESLDEQDPDYVSSAPSDAKQQKLYEENARANTARKITAIVEKEFSKEIDTKEKEVLQIQNRLHKAMKTLHLLRYVIITDFYNRKQCQAPQAGESKQTRIHPAIKQLIGKTPKHAKVQPVDSLVSSTSKNLQFTDSDMLLLHQTDLSESRAQKKFEEVQSDQKSGKRSIYSVNSKADDDASNDSEPPKKIPRYIPPKSGIPDGPSPSRGVHHKVRKRIVVGNISKWISPDWREDAASHKWTMYVRGSKEDADISDFVSKVRFFLHPSYQPNDVVEVKSSPFHLSRRGWGEFPLRVQLHFKNILNKPVDIIHFLKLDRTYTGLQTLGSETVVDIWIQTVDPRTFNKTLDLESSSKSTLNYKEEDKDVTMDVSAVKKEFPDQEVVNFDTNNLKISDTLKVESEDENIRQLKSSIESDHDYVSSKHRHIKEPVQYDCDTENNVTIEHSPSSSPNHRSTSQVDSSNLQNGLNGNLNSDESIAQLTENSIVHGIEGRNIVEDHKYLSVDSDVKVFDELKCHVSGSDGDQISNGVKTQCVEVNNTTCRDVSSIVSGVAKITQVNVKNATDSQSALKNSQNGNGALPVKLMKRDNKIFFVTDVDKRSNTKLHLTNLAASNVVKNMFANKVLSSVVKVQGNTSVVPKNVVSIKTNTQNDFVRTRLQGESKGITILKSSASQDPKLGVTQKLENFIDSSAEFLQNSMLHSGQTNTDVSKNVQKMDVRKLTSNLKEFSSKLEPLEITIPPTFESMKPKQVLVLKNNKLISVNTTSLLKSKSQETSSNSIGSLKLSEQKTESLSVEQRVSLLNMNSLKSGNNMPIARGVSLLKRSVINNATKSGNARPADKLWINPSNSLLLNATSNIPTLQIAKPLHSTHLEQQNNQQHILVASQKSCEQSKLNRWSKNIKIEESDNSKPMKITLGKDKYKLQSRKEIYEEAIRSIDNLKINDIMGALKFIIKRIPLIAKDASDLDYKRIHPYACASEEEFLNYNIGKQRALEYYRAKAVRSFLRKKGFTDDELWSMKEIIIWARFHGYTPVRPSLTIARPAIKTAEKTPDVNNLTLSTCTESVRFNEWLESFKESKCLENDNDADIEVDVVGIAEKKVKTEVKQNSIDTREGTVALKLPDELTTLYNFVSETTREIGVRLEPEEIVPGVMHCAAGRMIMQAVQCLVDDLGRLSLAKARRRNSNKCPETIVLDDVRSALLSREEFDIFTNAGLGSQRDDADWSQ